MGDFDGKIKVAYVGNDSIGKVSIFCASRRVELNVGIEVGSRCCNDGSATESKNCSAGCSCELKLKCGTP